MDIIHSPVFIIRNISETGCCQRPHLGPINRASLLLTIEWAQQRFHPRTESEYILRKVALNNNRTISKIQKFNNHNNTLFSQTFLQLKYM